MNILDVGKFFAAIAGICILIYFFSPENMAEDEDVSRQSIKESESQIDPRELL
jgi:hypothetical protein